MIRKLQGRHGSHLSTLRQQTNLNRPRRITHFGHESLAERITGDRWGGIDHPRNMVVMHRSM